MQEEKTKIDQLVAEYAESYQPLIQKSMFATEKEFEIFIISLIM